MKKIHFTIHINAPKESVWDTMLGDATYREWTKAFSAGSYYKGDWSEGSKILFLGPSSQEGEESGMVSQIEVNKKYEFISIKHLGLVKDGVEDTESEEAKKWAPAYENYTFIESEGGTTLQIDMEIEEEYTKEFERMWPEALENLRALAEG